MPRRPGFILLSRIAAGAILLAGTSGCANRVRVAGFGDLPPAEQVRAYRVVTVKDGTPDEQRAALLSALEAALIRKGLVADANSDAGIEAGFSIRSPRIALENGMATAHAFRPFCRRQLYVLSLIVSDRQSGRILAERQASAMRCRWASPEAITRLTNAAINQPVPPKFRTHPPQAPSAAQ